MPGLCRFCSVSHTDIPLCCFITGLQFACLSTTVLSVVPPFTFVALKR